MKTIAGQSHAFQVVRYKQFSPPGDLRSWLYWAWFVWDWHFRTLMLLTVTNMLSHLWGKVIISEVVWTLPVSTAYKRLSTIWPVFSVTLLPGRYELEDSLTFLSLVSPPYPTTTPGLQADWPSTLTRTSFQRPSCVSESGKWKATSPRPLSSQSFSFNWFH